MRASLRYVLIALASLVGAPVWADGLRVVTDIVPVQSLAAQVMGDLGTPVLLLEQGASAHDFQLRPSQAAILAKADLVVWVGPELTPWLDRALVSIAPDAVHLGLLAAPSTQRRAFGAEGHDDHDHGAEGESAHDADGTDPHAWLDPGNAIAWLDLIAQEVSRLDPANAARYDANAEAAKASIADLDAGLAALLMPVRDRPFVVYHDAYGYFAAHYGLTVAGAVASGDATAPGAARLSLLQDSVSQGEVPCLFPEAQHDPALVALLAEGNGARIGGALDPEGSLVAPGVQGYAETLQNLADTLVACLAPQG